MPNRSGRQGLESRARVSTRKHEKKWVPAMRGRTYLGNGAWPLRSALVSGKLKTKEAADAVIEGLVFDVKGSEIGERGWRRSLESS